MATAALVAASDFNSEHFKSLWHGGIFDEVIAVDGGYASLCKVGCQPNLAMGDFDSLGYEPADVPTLTFPSHKDASDLELALAHVKEQGAGLAYIYGAFGGRIDHTLGNVQLLARYAEEGMGIVAITPSEVLHYLVGPGSLELPSVKQGTVSVFSLVPESKGVTEHGLEYPLHDATLTDRTTLGLSNEFTGQRASVTVEEGTLIIVRPFIPS